MSTPPPEPVERHSLYPEAHRVGDWAPPTAPGPRRLRPVLLALAALGVVALAVVVGLDMGGDRGTAIPMITNPDGQEINAIQAEPGTCLAAVPADGAVARVTAVPCTEPHRAEVVSSLALPGETWPGLDEVTTTMLEHCGGVIQPGFDSTAMFKPGDWEDGLRWVAWVPTERSWGANERTGVCVAYRDHSIIGSFVAGTATFTD